MPRILPVLILLALAALPARAVIVRGKVTSPLGEPLPGARVQLIQGPRSVADTISGPDGEYEIRTTFHGRFVLLTAPSVLSPEYAPQVGAQFYAGVSDLVTVNIALNRSSVAPKLTAQTTLVPTPERQLASPPTQIPANALLTHTSLIPELRVTPGTFLLQQGETGTPAVLYLRGAPPATLLTTVDGVTANDLGQSFNLSTISTTGFATVGSAPVVELASDANPLHLTGTSAGVLSLAQPKAENLHRTLTYTGMAGNLGAYRNEAVGTWARGRFDLLGAFGRFDTQNDLPAIPFHLASYAANLGYHISAGTSLRLTARDDVSAGGLASPYQFFLITPQGREAHQNLFAAATFETRTNSGWHNLARYGLARKRGQTFDYATPATGLPVTINGANGYATSGTAAFIPLPAREDVVTDRDEATWQSDYRFKSWIGLAAEFRYQRERAADVLASEKQTLERDHFSGALGLSGSVKRRFFYETSGFLDHTQLLGFTGEPRLGLTYVPVRPGTRKFRGTSLHLTAAAGTREPSLLEQAANPNALTSPRSRTFDASVDQNILGEKLTLHATYFHNQFSHEFEPLSLSPAQPFRAVLSQTLALRTQGLEAAATYQPYRHVRLAGGYDYLAAVTQQSAETASFNPAFPAFRIGGLTALAGQRPFHRPPQSGTFRAEYSGARLNASIQGLLASKSDDSTNLVQNPGLLLPNRNLSPGYASLDARLSAVVTRHVTFLTQLTNLTDSRHIAPIGYLSTPFLVQTGLRIRIGRE
jgi:iron complex outermembrane receptor protein/vitamin B12 transporter